MDYSQYKVLEFHRKFLKILGASITIFDGSSDKVVGFISVKAFSLRGDFRVYTDPSKKHEVIRIIGKQVISYKPDFDVIDSTTNQTLIMIRNYNLKSSFVRDHMDLIDAKGDIYGYVEETNSKLALFRRWIVEVPFVGFVIQFILAFVPQTFEIYYAPHGVSPKIAGEIIHRKNPFIVKMSLDVRKAQEHIDPRISIAICTILSLLDADKNQYYP